MLRASDLQPPRVALGRAITREPKVFLLDEPLTVIDPKLFDILYDVNVRLGNPEATFEILSAYRSAQTNAMLRRSSNGVARNSLHLTGQALDVKAASRT